MYETDFSINEERDLILNNVDMLNEAYFGKTESIQAIEKQLDIFRKRYMGYKKLPLNDPELLRLNDLIAQQFGFANFSLIVTFDPVPMAVSLPLNYKMSFKEKENNFIVDINTYKFRPQYQYNCSVIMTSGLIFNSFFTTEEVMACLLYELGYVFFSCYSRSHARLAVIYTATQIASIVAGITGVIVRSINIANLTTNRFYKLSKDKMLEDPSIASMLKEIEQKAGADVRDKTLDNIFNNKVKPAIQKQADTTFNTTLGYALPPSVIEYFINSPLYNSMQKTINNKMMQFNSTVESTAISFKNYTGLLIKYIGKNASYFSSVWLNLILNNMGVFKALHIFDVLLPYKSFISSLFNPMTYINMPVVYNVDKAASHFPTMYGYGPAAVTYFNKMKSNRRIEVIRKVVDRCPLIGIVSDTTLMPMRILNGVLEPKPSQLSLSISQLDYLEKELSDAADPRMVAAIHNDIALCKNELTEIIYNKTDLSNSDLFRALYMKFLWNMTSGKDVKDFLFGHIISNENSIIDETLKESEYPEPVIQFNTPEQLVEWLHNNASHDETSAHIKSPEEFLAVPRGSSHDYALFASYMLQKVMGIRSSVIVFVERSLTKHTLGKSYSIVIFYGDDGKSYYMDPYYKDPNNKYSIYEFDNNQAIYDYFRDGWEASAEEFDILEYGIVRNDKVYDDIQDYLIDTIYPKSITINKEYEEALNSLYAEFSDDIFNESLFLWYDASKIKTLEDADKMLQMIADKQDASSLISLLRRICFILAVLGPISELFLKIASSDPISSAFKVIGQSIGWVSSILFNMSGMGGAFSILGGIGTTGIYNTFKKYLQRRKIIKSGRLINNLRNNLQKIKDAFGYIGVNLIKFIIGDWIIIKLINYIFNMNYATIGEKEIAYTVVIKILNDNIKVAEEHNNPDIAQKFRVLLRKAQDALKNHNLTTSLI